MLSSKGFLVCRFRLGLPCNRLIIGVRKLPISLCRPSSGSRHHFTENLLSSFTLNNEEYRNFHCDEVLSNVNAAELTRTDGENNPSEAKTMDTENNFEQFQDIILFNSVLEQRKMKNSWLKMKIESERKHRRTINEYGKTPRKIDIPFALKYMPGYKELICNVDKGADVSDDTVDENIVQLPFNIQSDMSNHLQKNLTNSENVQENSDCAMNPTSDSSTQNPNYSLGRDSRQLNWMKDYDLYDERDENLPLSEYDEERPWELDYGTPDVTVPISKVPCGGCGALLHCQDTAIPGYLPSEIVKDRTPAELRSITCQRCHFMRHYDTALSVNVSADEYPRLLAQIRDKKALVLLMVDLMDFPCSIWPNILDIIGTKRPVVVVGNKVDLLPQDSPGFLHHIEKVLTRTLGETGLDAANIKHVALVSAKTGYGIDQLITKLHNAWEYKGDVYLVGCTNVGKSTLFNALLQSDYCKVQAVDLIQRATTSPWPGTTLNLLKVGTSRPAGLPTNCTYARCDTSDRPSYCYKMYVG